MSIKVISATPLSNMRLLVTFENDIVKLFDVRSIVPDYPEYAALENPDLFSLVQVEPGGYGVAWTSELDASEGELWENSIELPLNTDDLRTFIARNVVTTSEACELLTCTRQNIDDLVRRRKLRPLSSSSRGKLFLRSDISLRRASGDNITDTAQALEDARNHRNLSGPYNTLQELMEDLDDA